MSGLHPAEGPETHVVFGPHCCPGDVVVWRLAAWNNAAYGMAVGCKPSPYEGAGSNPAHVTCSMEVTMAGQRCPGRDEVDGRTRACPTILTNGERRCPRHAKAYEQRRGTSTQRGYGSAHQRLRAAWQRRIDDGEHVTCATCPTTITGRMWQLGHDHVNGGYLGPQCVPCNTADGGRRGAQASRPTTL